LRIGAPGHKIARLERFLDSDTQESSVDARALGVGAAGAAVWAVILTALHNGA
jgi:hypothetical protein